MIYTVFIEYSMIFSIYIHDIYSLHCIINDIFNIYLVFIELLMIFSIYIWFSLNFH